MCISQEYFQEQVREILLKRLQDPPSSQRPAAGSCKTALVERTGHPSQKSIIIKEPAASTRAIELSVPKERE